jgi:hypothetical protein
MELLLGGVAGRPSDPDQRKRTDSEEVHSENHFARRRICWRLEADGVIRAVQIAQHVDGHPALPLSAVLDGRYVINGIEQRKAPNSCCSSKFCIEVG